MSKSHITNMVMHRYACQIQRCQKLLFCSVSHQDTAKDQYH